MRKGNIVRLNPITCFTTENEGGLDYPLTHRLNDEAGIVEGYRHPTTEELEAWRNSPASKGMNSAGESKLPPTAVTVSVHRGDKLRIERARVRMSFFYRTSGGWAKVSRVSDGEVFFIKRDRLEVLAA